MTSRRSRIKGIANIPQRRKNIVIEKNNEDNLPINENGEKNIEQLLPESDKLDNPLTCGSLQTGNILGNEKVIAEDQSGCKSLLTTCNEEITHVDTKTEIIHQSIQHELLTHEQPIVEQKTFLNPKPELLTCNESIIKPIDDKIILPGVSIKPESVHEPHLATCNENVLKPTEENTVISEVNKNTEILHEPKQQVLPLIKRRTFLKPAVSASVFNRKPKQNIERADSETSSVEKTPPGIDKTVTSTGKPIEQVSLEQATENTFIEKSSIAGQEVTLDEVHIAPQIDIPSTSPAISSEISEEVLDKTVKKILPQTNNAPSSDTEYPPPPPSPSKINRSRIKAIPRLGYRKTSFSASESEDESKRHYNRNRNDSVCSTASGVPESISDCFSPQRPKDFNATVPKKCIRTEQSRKLAEARREFQRRFGANKPDRQRLTMIDLIFYNPTSNPMTSESKSKADKEEVEDINVNQEDIESEKVDEPQHETVEEAAKSDEENEIPVPQIKIGPSGEIIIDEKSLVIENKELKKQREELQKKKLVDGDFDTGYGIYKRTKRAKEWTHGETLRFYKALNTIGSDFTLMCELFPKRTRRELKQKFKKEERVNRTLIDKAMMQPCSFDYTELKHEVDMEEKELEELRKQKEEELKLKQERQLKKRKAIEKAELERVAEKTNDELNEQPKPPKIRKVRKPRLKKFNIESVLEDSDADVSDIATQSESEGEEKIVAPLKPTRSGRMPKVTKKFDTSEEFSIENIMKRNKVSGDNTSANDIEPGSIMIVTDVGPNGEPVHKIFMVTADKNATPVNLNSDVVSKAIQFKKGISAQNILTISENATDDEGEAEQVTEENNVTIPADEGITSLRGNVGMCSEDVGQKQMLQNATLQPETLKHPEMV